MRKKLSNVWEILNIFETQNKLHQNSCIIFIYFFCSIFLVAVCICNCNRCQGNQLCQILIQTDCIQQVYLSIQVDIPNICIRQNACGSCCGGFFGCSFFGNCCCFFCNCRFFRYGCCFFGCCRSCFFWRCSGFFRCCSRFF